MRLNKVKIMKLIRYVIVGILTTFVSFSIFWLLCYRLVIEPNIANVISIIGAIIFAYIANKKIVFKSKLETTVELIKEMTSFFLSRGLTIVVEVSGVFLLVTIMKFDAMISKIGISILVTLLNYIISQFWVFKK